MAKKPDDPRDHDQGHGNDDKKPKAEPKAGEQPPHDPKEPYPSGSPQDPEDAFEQAHGYRREKPKE